MQSLKYLDACIKEASRVLPSIRTTPTRLVCKGGATICGEFVPENTAIGVNFMSAFLSNRNFCDPGKFVPERWLDTTGKYANDAQDALHPWGLGPRICIAKE